MSSNVGPVVTTSGLLVNFDPGVSLVNYNKNYNPYSEDLANILVSKPGLSTNANVITAPNGTSTADLVFNNSAGVGYINTPSLNVVAGVTYCFSMYVKAGSVNTVNTLLYGTHFNNNGSNVGVLFDLSTGGTSATPGCILSTYYGSTPVGNGWYRVFVAHAATVTVSATNQQHLRMNTSVINDSVYAWGLQVEIGTSPTEYFPASGNKTATTWTNLVTQVNSAANIPTIANLVSPPVGQVQFANSGTFSWVVPAGVTSVSVVAIGGGGGGGSVLGSGGGGGALAYGNDIAVTPGSTVEITVGRGGRANEPGGSSSFGSAAILSAGGGTQGTTGTNGSGGGGGGAGGYTGAGGNSGSPLSDPQFNGGNGGIATGTSLTAGFPGGQGGQSSASNVGFTAGANSTGGGGGGGTGGWFSGSGGGGTLFIALGANGIGAAGVGINGRPGQGRGGSGGGDGSIGIGGFAGGGSGGASASGGLGGGGVRIIWGPNRRYPATSTIDQPTVVATPTPIFSTSNSGMLTFNGTDQGINIPTSVLNTVYTGKTIFAFVRLDSNFGASAVYRGIVGTSDATLLRNINMYIFGSTPSTFQIHYSTSNGITNYGSTSNLLTLTANQWCCVAVTQNATGLVNYYFNGTAAGVNSHPLTQYNATSAEYIGRNETYWYGDIGTVMIYNRALSQVEITQNFNSLRSRYGI